MVVSACNPITQEVKQEEQEFEPRLPQETLKNKREEGARKCDRGCEQSTMLTIHMYENGIMNPIILSKKETTH